MIFYKTSSFGNDFIEIDLEELASAMPRRPRGGLADLPGRRPLGDLARQICDRQRGVGADGVVYYRASRQAARPGESSRKRVSSSPGAARKQPMEFRIFNRDGSEAELSGNGMAGLAAVLFQRRLGVSPLTLHAAIGSRQVELLGRDGAVFQLAVEIGRPDFANREFFPFLKQATGPGMIAGMEFHPVSVGNPHAVVICREMPEVEQLAAMGKEIEGHAMFPKRVNVEFVRPVGPGSCQVFFYERGVGPTLASSTGSAAVFAVLRRLGMAGDRLDIDLEAAAAAEDPAGKEPGSQGPGYRAGAGSEKIQVSWHGGIFIRNFTRIICRGEYFL